MGPKRIAILAVAAALAAIVGFRASRRTGIQPGYFEKQEAPAYGVSKDRPMGSDLGRQYQEYFQKLYEKP